VLSVASIAGLVLAGKYGVALTTFTVIYAFSFNAFNLLYFGVSELNLVSAVVNALATVYLFSILLKKA
jgi:phosphatidylglycerophosphatase A